MQPRGNDVSRGAVFGVLFRLFYLSADSFCEQSIVFQMI